MLTLRSMQHLLCFTSLVATSLEGSWIKPYAFISAGEQTGLLTYRESSSDGAALT